MGKQQLCNPKQAIVVARKLAQLATAPPPPPPVPPVALRTYTLCELVTQNRALLLQALQQGHRFKDLQALFSSLGVSIAETTFYRYLREPKDEQSSQPDIAALTVSAPTDPATQSAQLTELIAVSPSLQLTPEQIVTAAYEPIQRALKGGYTFTEIAKIFQKRHVAVSVRQLKKEYLKLEASQQAAVLPAVDAPVSATPANTALQLVTTVGTAALAVVSASLTSESTVPYTAAETVGDTGALTVTDTAEGTTEPMVEATVTRPAARKAKRTVSPHVSLADRKRHRAKRAETRAALARG